MSEGFQFKQFYVRHSNCAMKVGTDGVLLGAWTPITNLQVPISDRPVKVLDIGTGSGLIALMLAQRCPKAQIDAIDVDAEAVAQAQENFLRSPWVDRLSAHHSSLQNWQMGNANYYDLIVSNPPYFRNSLKNPDVGRQTARHTDTLSYEELIAHSARLLMPNGTFTLILPAEAETEICTLAQKHGFVPAHIARVYSKESKPARRVLIAFQPSVTCILPPEISQLILENEKGGRSAAYLQLAQDFYL